MRDGAVSRHEHQIKQMQSKLNIQVKLIKLV